MKKPKANDWMRPTDPNAYLIKDVREQNLKVDPEACKRHKRRLLLEQKHHKENWDALAT